MRNASPSRSPPSFLTSCAAPRRSSRGQHIVHDEDALPTLDRVLVDLEGVGSIFERIALLERLRRQLARLTDRNEPGLDALGNRRTQNEPAALDADDDVDALPDEWAGEHVDRHRESVGVPQQGRDVVEENAAFGKAGRVDVLLNPRTYVVMRRRYAPVDPDVTYTLSTRRHAGPSAAPARDA